MEHFFYLSVLPRQLGFVVMLGFHVLAWTTMRGPAAGVTRRTATLAGGQMNTVATAGLNALGSSFNSRTSRK